MAAKIFATYSLKKGKPLGPLRGLAPLGPFFMALVASQTQRAKPKGPDSENNSSQVDPLGLAFPFTQSALGCYGFFMP